MWSALFEFMICRDFMSKAAVVNHCQFRCTVMTFMLWRGTLGEKLREQ